MKHLEIINYFKSLDSQEQKKVVNDLLEHLTTSENNLYKIRQTEINKNGLVCPHCRSKEVVGYGAYKEVKRYKCKTCLKTFSSLTGSVVFWLHKKELVRQYLYFMLQGYSLRKISSKMDICLKTAFDWRHKMLNSLNTDKGSSLMGIVESDETFFLYSEKGNKNLRGRTPRKRGGEASKKGINKDHVTVLTAYERKSGHFMNTVVCRGRITKIAIENGLGKWLDKDGSILCVDSHKSFEGFAIDNNIEVKRVFVRRNEHVIEKIYHIQHVNNIHSNLKKWMVRFNGVATKYLQNYMNYFALVTKLNEHYNNAQKALDILLQKSNVYVKRDIVDQQICIT